MGTELTSENTLASQTESLESTSNLLGQLVYLEIGAGVLVGLYGLYAYWAHNTVAWLVIGGIGLFLGFSHYLKTDEIEADKQKIESGRSGENFVSKLLRENLPDDVYVLNDVDVDGGGRTAQNDHILLHSSGIYLIETKTYGGHLEGHAEDEKWTQVKDLDDSASRQQVTNPIQQNEYHREVFEAFLDEQAIDVDESDIHCLVAMVVKETDWEIEGDASSVDYAWKTTNQIKRNLGQDRISEKTLRAILNGLNISIPPSLK